MATPQAETMSEQHRGGTVEREEFGARELAVRGETAATAVAEQAKAAVQARYVMALQRPRDTDTVRMALLKECRRPSFAAVARYRKPIGKGIEGPSIRFAEAALRCLTNMLPETTVLFDDDRKRLVKVSVTDLESNVTYSKDIVIDKVVERRQLREGQRAIGSRMNSDGVRVFLVEATEDDLLNKQGALESKALRTLALRHLPGDILDECMTQVKETVAKKDAEDPDGARKRLVAAFDEIGVKPSDLREYLGHDLDHLQPVELQELREVYTTLREGEATWAACLEHKTGKADKPAAAPSTPLQDAARKAKGKKADLFEEPGSSEASNS